MTGCIGPFDTQRVTTLYISLLYILVSTLTSSLPLLGNGFTRQTFPFALRPLSVFGLSYQLQQQQLTTTEPQSSLTTNAKQSCLSSRHGRCRKRLLHSCRILFFEWKHACLTVV
jgi:hypothetical protein